MKNNLFLMAAFLLMLVPTSFVFSQQININLKQGWNWISYPRADTVPLAYGLAGITPSQGDMIKSQTAFSIYDTEDGWSGSLTELIPGIGYMYKSNSSQSLSFSFPDPSVPFSGTLSYFFEGFEGGAMPEGWTSVGPNHWEVGVGDYTSSTGTATGSYNAYINHLSTGQDTYLVTPLLDLSGVPKANLSFSVVNRSWAGDIDGFGVYYRTNGSAWHELYSSTQAHSTWTTISLALEGLAANYQIGFLFHDNYGYGIGLDDVEVSFFEGFEDGVMPAGWTSEGPNQWEVSVGDYSSSTGPATGSYNAKIIHLTTGQDTYFVTPMLDLSGMSNATLSFSMVNRSWVGDFDSFGVYYRTNGGAWHELCYITENHPSWTPKSLTLVGLAANYQIGFMFHDNYGYGIGLDDVKISNQACAQNTLEGAIDGRFSVSESEQIYFSKGNLQYQASTGTWRFAEHQYDIIGEANLNISSTYSGWIDLFGWGTSGWNSGNMYYRPYEADHSDESLYGPNGNYDLTGTYANADWGVYNPISNGGNVAGQWRTLTAAEWEYVINTRSTASSIRYAKAQVNNVNGVILLPDDWSNSYYTLSNTNSSEAAFTSNVIESSTWQSAFETHGAVFLPAAGSRYWPSVYSAGSIGYYWSSSYYGSGGAYGVLFYDDDVYTYYDYYRPYGQSVRLVRAL